MSVVASWYNPTFPVTDAPQLEADPGDSAEPSSFHSTSRDPPADRYLASFIFLAAGLEKSLRVETSLLFDSSTTFSNVRTSLGSGHSFIVERAEWKGRTPVGLQTTEITNYSKVVALKHVVRDGKETSQNWNDVLLEIRALLHEPIRYHPNIVRLFGLTWGALEGTRSPFPVLVFEYAEFGTLRELQLSSEVLPFDTKKSLCLDVAKGISILHACGIIHGDLKHENVLVFRHKDPKSPVAYTAKIGDFGGSVMDLTPLDGARRRLRLHTKPFNAPEVFKELDAQGLKMTDVYSLGLLVWRVFLDGVIPFDLPEFADYDEDKIEELKSLDRALPMAQSNLQTTQNLAEEELKIVHYVLAQSLPADSELRDLQKIIAALQGQELTTIDQILRVAEERNEEEARNKAAIVAGSHYMTKDSLGVYIAKTSNGDYDYQQAGPGHRSKLPHPDPAEFSFDIVRLKPILEWNLQAQIAQDLEYAATSPWNYSPIRIPAVKAAFVLFRCYLLEFGVKFNAERACHWLKQAASSSDECEENYIAQAICWRVHQALGITLDVTLDELRDWIHTSIFRGHRQCIYDSRQIISKLTSNASQWTKGEENCRKALSTIAAGLGMPYFLPRRLYRQYNLQDMTALDESIQAELVSRNKKSLDDIYINNRAHGLLHYAAAMGRAEALKHLLQTYSPDIDIESKGEYDTPLLCACRGGHLDCALLLLDAGATPNGASDLDSERPLLWLCAFSEEDIPVIAHKLVEHGASLASHRSTRSSGSSAWADYEHIFNLPTSPLSRAVMMNSLPAVKALLELGADPLEGVSTMSSTCAVVMAAVLTMPRMLEVLLQYIDEKEAQPRHIFDEIDMLQAALDKVATFVDPTSLESRLARRGPTYQSDMFEVLDILHRRSVRTRSWRVEGPNQHTEAANTILARLVSLGRVDIVDYLLRLGVNHSRQPFVSPLAAAVRLNHDVPFRMLIGYGADPLAKVTSPSGSQVSLLQVLAERSPQSRPGTFIAGYLIDAGVPVDPLPDSSPSPFVSAVRNQDFALAELLRRRGAAVDFRYIDPRTQGDARVWTTVPFELLRRPNESNVESLRYLLQRLEKPPDSGRGPEAAFDPLAIISPPASDEAEKNAPRTGTQVWKLPNPIATNEDAMSMSILHAAAVTRPRSNAEAQAMRHMLGLVLSEKSYATKEVLDLVHPILGTALISAAASEDFESVQALVEAKADVNVEFKGYRVLDVVEALKNSVLKGLEETKVIGVDGRGRREELKNRLKKLVMIRELLVGVGAKWIGATSTPA